MIVKYYIMIDLSDYISEIWVKADLEDDLCFAETVYEKFMMVFNDISWYLE